MLKIVLYITVLFVYLIGIPSFCLDSSDVEKDIYLFTSFAFYEIDTNPKAIDLVSRLKRFPEIYATSIAAKALHQIHSESTNYVFSCCKMLSLIQTETAYNLLADIYISIDKLFLKRRSADDKSRLFDATSGI